MFMVGGVTVLDVDGIVRVLAEHKQELRDRFGLGRLAFLVLTLRVPSVREAILTFWLSLRSPWGFSSFWLWRIIYLSFWGVKVDLVSKKALKPRIGRRILKEVVYV